MPSPSLRQAHLGWVALEGGHQQADRLLLQQLLALHRQADGTGAQQREQRRPRQAHNGHHVCQQQQHCLQAVQQRADGRREPADTTEVEKLGWTHSKRKQADTCSSGCKPGGKVQLSSLDAQLCDSLALLGWLALAPGGS